MALRRNKKKSTKVDLDKKTKVENEMENQTIEVEQEIENQEETVATEDSQKQYDELKDKYLRLFADFDNFRKRTIKDKLDMMKSAAQDTLSALLPILDDFDRARNAAEQNGNGGSFNEGIGLIIHKFDNILSQKGLKEMDTNGKPFDAELHEAITEIPAPNKKMKGHIIDTIEKGYYLNDKIIRHAKVVVGK